MLSNLIVSSQRLVIIIDELGQEKISHKFLTQLLREQGEDGFIKTFPADGQKSLDKFLSDCCNDKLTDSTKWNVILPNLSNMLVYQKPREILNSLKKLKRNECIKRTFLWISPQHLIHEHSQFLIAACESMANIVLHLLTSDELTVVTRKQGGSVTNNRYSYTKTKTEFKVKPKTEESKQKVEEDAEKPEQLGTFKIELNEEEIVARNAMKMPYEKAMEATESSIIYTPDAADDFDDEDPDEDLNI